jgi:hypothetical protein
MRPRADCYDRVRLIERIGGCELGGLRHCSDHRGAASALAVPVHDCVNRRCRGPRAGGADRGGSARRGSRGGIHRAELGLSFPTGLGGPLGSAAWAASIDVDLAGWHANAREDQRSRLLDVGLTPQVRVMAPARDSFEPFVDIGVGLHALNAHDLGEVHLGTGLQFGEYLGIGFRFGDRHRFAAVLRLLHESNCGIKSANGGLTAFGLRLEYTPP